MSHIFVIGAIFSRDFVTFSIAFFLLILYGLAKLWLTGWNLLLFSSGFAYLSLAAWWLGSTTKAFFVQFNHVVKQQEKFFFAFVAVSWALVVGGISIDCTLMTPEQFLIISITEVKQHQAQIIKKIQGTLSRVWNSNVLRG